MLRLAKVARKVPMLLLLHFRIPLLHLDVLTHPDTLANPSINPSTSRQVIRSKKGAERNVDIVGDVFKLLPGNMCVHRDREERRD